MNYYFKSISYEQCDPFKMPTIIAEVEIWPESNKELLDICKGINSTSLKGLEQLKSMFNSRPNLPTIKNVYFNPPATVVLWDDGTKTVVKCQDGDTYSKETGLALCMAKKAIGNSSRQFNDIFKKWIPEEKKPVHRDIDGWWDKMKNTYSDKLYQCAKEACVPKNVYRSCYNCTSHFGSRCAECDEDTLSMWELKK